MLRKLTIGLLSTLIAQQVATAQQNSSDTLNTAAQAAAAFDNPDPPAINQPLPAPVADVQTGIAVDAAAAEVPGGGEILLSGPLHEAYAEQFTIKPIAGLIVSKRPPDPIDEIPPEYRPEGSDVVWIPGYWGWDAERDDFVWVTGIWRLAPPNHVWIPGYWAEVADGYQWISGFWSPSDVQEVVYLPAPPEPVDATPGTDAPGDNYFWVPGQWVWVDTDYEWRAGYWAVAYPDWVWVPERYVYTPSGYIYRTGYWDYMLTDRGTIFAPVYWSNPVATYQLRPTYVINAGTSLLANLFVYPQYHHYYFGNYYSSRYLGQTIYPWVTVTQQAQLYDPLYAYYRTQHRDVAFLQRISRMHTYYASNPNLQPPRTLAMQMRSASVAQQTNAIAFQAVPLQQLVSSNEAPMQYVRLQAQDRQRLQAALQPARELRKERAQNEEKAAAAVAQSDKDGAAAVRQGQAGQRDQARAAGGGNRWRLPTSQNDTTLGAAALVAGDRSSQGVRGADGDKAQAQSRDAAQSGKEGARTADRRNADRAGADRRNADRAAAAGDTAGQDRGQPRAGRERAEMDRESQERAVRERAQAGTDRERAVREGAAREGAGRQAAGSDRADANGRTANRPDLDARQSEQPGTAAERAQAERAQTDRSMLDRPGLDRQGLDRQGLDRSKVDRPGLDRSDSDQRGVGSPGTDLPRTSVPGAAAPGTNLPGANLPGTEVRRNDLPKNDLPGASRRSSNRLDLDANRPGSNRPGSSRFNQPGSQLGQPGGNPLGTDSSRPDAPSVDRPNARRTLGGSTQGSAPSSTPLGGGDRGSLPGLGADRPSTSGSGLGAGQGSIQDDMRALRDLQRRDAERRRSSPPDVRSLPQRPQPPAGSDRPDSGRGRNSGIVPGVGVPAAGSAATPPSASAKSPAAGRPGPDAKPGRGNGKDKDKDKK